MVIDTTHLHHWMNAIRKSENPIRTLDAFWKGQMQSKEWLVCELEKIIDKKVKIEIHGGWVGVLSSLLFQSSIKIESVLNLDIDPTCKEIAEEMNRIEFNDNRFSSITKNMCDHIPDADVIINTSCEHISQEQYELWLNKIPKGKIIVLQSNNYNIPEHIRLAKSLENFVNQSMLDILFYQGEKIMPLYSRYMLIGIKN